MINVANNLELNCNVYRIVLGIRVCMPIENVSRCHNGVLVSKLKPFLNFSNERNPKREYGRPQG